MHDNAGRRKDCQRRRIRDTVIGLDKLNPKASQVDGLTVLYHLSLGILKQVMLLQLIFDQSYGQLCSIHRRIDLLQYIGQGPDMILMAMSNDKSLYLVDVLL